jgi:hypothetical protein
VNLRIGVVGVRRFGVFVCFGAIIGNLTQILELGFTGFGVSYLRKFVGAFGAGFGAGLVCVWWL